jgi:hypothetical protein
MLKRVKQEVFLIKDFVFSYGLFQEQRSLERRERSN